MPNTGDMRAARIRYLVFPWWPEDGADWICPEDVRLVRRLIPSDRVFRYERNEGVFNVMRYGRHLFRIRPTLAKEVPADGFDVGDWVQVRSLLGKNRPLIAQIREMRWHDRDRTIRYYLRQRRLAVARSYGAEDIAPLEHVPLEAQAAD